MTDSTDDETPACQTCSDPVASASQHRVVTSLEDGEAAYQHFCSDACLESWSS